MTILWQIWFNTIKQMVQF